MSELSKYLKIDDVINSWYEKRNIKPSRIISEIIGLYVLYKLIKNRKNILNIYRDFGLSGLITYPLLKFLKNNTLTGGIIKKENAKARKEIEHSLKKNVGGKCHKNLPKIGIPKDKLLKQFIKWGKIDDNHWRGGQVSGTVYHGGDDLTDFLRSTTNIFYLSNILHPDVFPCVRKMESEVLSMVLGLFHGDKDSVGSTTSGGTESILMAILSYRNRAKALKGIDRPELIIPRTAHAAFHKACGYFNIKPVIIDHDPDTFKVDVKAVEKAINHNTIGLVGSAVNYPSGDFDDMKALSDLGLKYDVPVHADCCLGFILPFLTKIGIDLPPYDFQLGGICSISCDTHKYGFSPKGISTVLYRNKEYRKYQYFISTTWPGGIYATAAMGGSRPGSPIVGAYAALLTMGEDGYKKAATEIMKTVNTIIDGITNEIPELKVIGKPQSTVVGFTTINPKELDVYHISGAMSTLGWNLNNLQFPPGVHIGCTYMHRDKGDKFIGDLKKCIALVKGDPEKYKNKGGAALYGMAKIISDRSIVEELSSTYLDVSLEVAEFDEKKEEE